MKRLNLGCGPKHLEGYINIDVVPSRATDLVADVVRLPMYDDDSVDEIRMDAAYEHLYRHERPGALREWFRILCPGGRLTINWIPDFDAVVEAYCHRRAGIQSAVFNLDEVWRYTHGKYSPSDVPFQVHKDIFTAQGVIGELEGAGFENVVVSKCRYGEEPVVVNLNAVAMKPGFRMPTRRLSAPDDANAGVATSAPRLSVVINTLNEERDLEDCLRSLEGFADEIVVVDMRSDDRTVEIARRYTGRILSHERTGVVEPARQFAIDQARGEWIFLLDADERVTAELAQLVQHAMTTSEDIVGYRVPRRNFIAGRWMTGTGWGTDVEWHMRLFRSGVVSWPREVHAVPIVRGRVENLVGPSEAVLLHYNYRDLREFVERLNTYTEFEAEKLLAAGEKFTWPHAMEAAAAELRSRYEPHKDGVHSLVLSVCMAFYRFLSWAKLWERCGHPEVDLPVSWEGLLSPSSAVRAVAPTPEQPSALDRGDQALHTGAWSEACEAFIEVLTREPVCAAARSGLGLALLSLGETAEGLAQLEEGVKLRPDPDRVSNLACGYMHVGRLAEAERLLAAVLAAAPQHEPARVNLRRLRDQGARTDRSARDSCDSREDGSGDGCADFTPDAAGGPHASEGEFAHGGPGVSGRIAAAPEQELVWLRAGCKAEFDQSRDVRERLCEAQAAVSSRLPVDWERFTRRGYCSVCRQPAEFLIDAYAALVRDGVRQPNWRERVVCPRCGLNNRTRAALHLFDRLGRPESHSRVYVTEQLTPLYQHLVSRYPQTIGSEYLGDRIPRGQHDARGIRNEDVTALTLGDASVDFVLCFDVLEHVGNYRAALAEFARILAPGGALLLTVPFATDADATITRAVLEPDGTIRHCAPPEYHGDPNDPERGCLLYRIFGWDLLPSLTVSGVSDPTLHLLWSSAFGYLGDPQIVLTARRDAPRDARCIAQMAVAVAEAPQDLCGDGKTDGRAMPAAGAGKFSSGTDRCARTPR